MKKILFSLIALLGIVACEQDQIDATLQTLRLSVDKNEIVADGSEKTTFSVTDSNDATVTDAKIYFADTNEVLEGNTFKTKYAGEYKFYAKRGNEKSNTIAVTATKATETPDDPNTPGGDDPVKKQIVLSVSPTTIKADGTESAVFTLKVDGKSATNLDVYNAANDSKLAGN